MTKMSNRHQPQPLPLPDTITKFLATRGADPVQAAMQDLTPVTNFLPTRVADPVRAAGDRILSLANPQSPMIASPPKPLAVINPDTLRQPAVVTPKAKSNALLVGGVVAAGLALMFLKK